jgi:hypothetical protein
MTQHLLIIYFNPNANENSSINNSDTNLVKPYKDLGFKVSKFSFIFLLIFIFF